MQLVQGTIKVKRTYVWALSLKSIKNLLTLTFTEAEAE
jgi:hypothetical protein